MGREQAEATGRSKVRITSIEQEEEAAAAAGGKAGQRPLSGAALFALARLLRLSEMSPSRAQLCLARSHCFPKAAADTG